ncbi:Nucleoside-diphosphate-sugar epimerase [Nonomuraea solani]|uniref:Nucleoside-diphosphate-sugar epimerase n=1 Tax=Nonomuraea solani TaxID=1144553 RepID=A0A1H5YNQ4_9ACTN|nr:NAD(P)-dependent oxidoreductase [Nonomuraea solani]SEG25205.1 Nucleoside-diphosphate-sugar epimerase [Nonomuraea solani]
MRVFVAGGTGAIGGHTIPALLRAGHEVTALARTPGKAAALADQGAMPVRVSLFDQEALTPVMAGHDAVVNLATAIPSMDKFMNTEAIDANYRVRAEGSAALAGAALAAGVGRMVQESVSMVYRDQGDRWIDEDAPVDDYPLTRGNFAAEASARRFAETGGGAGVVLRFGWFYGPGAAHSEQLYAMARRHVGMVLGRPDGYVSSIHMDDAASAVVAALEVPAGTYNVVDDEPLTKRAYAFALARAAGAATWVSGPGRLGYLFGDRLTSLTRSLRVGNGRFRTAAVWSPRHRSAREGWLATARDLG